MRPQPTENQKRAQQDGFEVEPERHCDLRLVYNLPHDEVTVITQPARRRHIARTITTPLIMDFDEEGMMIGMQLTTSLTPTDRHHELDVARALRPFKACDNITQENGIGYVYVRNWDPYSEDEVAYVIEADGELDLAHDGGLVAIRVPRTTADYELDPFAAFFGLPWVAETSAGALSQFGLM